MILYFSDPFIHSTEQDQRMCCEANKYKKSKKLIRKQLYHTYTTETQKSDFQQEHNSAQALCRGE
jgi:hypothetical protein